jgi:hypothetical protein
MATCRTTPPHVATATFSTLLHRPICQCHPPPMPVLPLPASTCATHARARAHRRTRARTHAHWSPAPPASAKCACARFCRGGGSHATKKLRRSVNLITLAHRLSKGAQRSHGLSGDNAPTSEMADGEAADGDGDGDGGLQSVSVRIRRTDAAGGASSKGCARGRRGWRRVLRDLLGLLRGFDSHSLTCACVRACVLRGSLLVRCCFALPEVTSPCAHRSSACPAPPRSRPFRLRRTDGAPLANLAAAMAPPTLPIPRTTRGQCEESRSSGLCSRRKWRATKPQPPARSGRRRRRRRRASRVGGRHRQGRLRRS